MNIEDGVKFYDVCLYVSDSVRLFYSGRFFGLGEVFCRVGFRGVLVLFFLVFRIVWEGGFFSREFGVGLG